MCREHHERGGGGPSIIFAVAALGEFLTKPDINEVHILRDGFKSVILFQISAINLHFLCPNSIIYQCAPQCVRPCFYACDSSFVPSSTQKEEKRPRGAAGRTQKCFPDFDWLTRCALALGQQGQLLIRHKRTRRVNPRTWNEILNVANLLNFFFVNDPHPLTPTILWFSNSKTPQFYQDLIHSINFWNLVIT